MVTKMAVRPMKSGKINKTSKSVKTNRLAKTNRLTNKTKGPADKTTAEWLRYLQGGTTVLVDCGSKASSEDAPDIIRALAKRGYRHGLVVSLSWGCTKVSAACKALDHSAIACLYRQLNVEKGKHENCTFVQPLSSLTDLGIMLVEKMRYLPEEKSFCIIDSISELEQHNKPELIARFVNFINPKLKANYVDTIVLIHPRPRDVLKPMLVDLFDHVVEEENK